jgi:hypothetical protein
MRFRQHLQVLVFEEPGLSLYYEFFQNTYRIIFRANIA